MFNFFQKTYSFQFFSKIKTLNCLLAIFFFFSPSLFADELPFSAGEELFFRLRWEFIVGGSGSLRIEREKNAWHFIATGKSTPFLDHIYKVRLRIDAKTDPAMTRFFSYVETTSENGTDRSKNITFDPENEMVQRTDKDSTRVLKTDKKNLFDPLSLFYALRTQKLFAGAKLQVEITDGKDILIGTADVIKKEEISVPAGTFICWKIEPNIQDVGGVFKKSKDARMWLWVSADETKIPLRVKTKIALGSIVADLINIQGLDVTKMKSWQGKQKDKWKQKRKNW